MAAGYVLEGLVGLEPCPFCLRENYFLLVLAVVFLLMAWSAGAFRTAGGP